MKRLPIIVLFAFAAIVLAMDGLPAIPERSAMRVEWDAAAAYPIRVYTNGAFFHDISMTEIAAFTANADGSTRFRAVITAPPVGRYEVRLTAFDMAGVEGRPSVSVTQYFSLRPPGNPTFKEK